MRILHLLWTWVWLTVPLMTFPEVRVDVDCFAQFCNRKAKIFFSRREELGSTGVNFFSQRLFRSLSYYCFPPPGVILATILHLAAFGVSGLLVVPVWPSSSFWPNIVPDGQHLPIWSVKYLRFRASFVCDPEIYSTTFKNPPTFDSLILKFNFSEVQDSDLFTPHLVPENFLDSGCELCC